MAPPHSSEPVLIPQRQAVLDFIRTKVAETGIPPTFREIGEALNLHLSTAHHHAKVLAEAGYLERRQVDRIIQETRYFPTDLDLAA